jgi:hypothetical protein
VVVVQAVGLVAGGVAGGESRCGFRGERAVQAVEAQPVARLDTVVIGGVVELQRQDAEVGEVLPVDAGVGLGEDGASLEEPGEASQARSSVTVVVVRTW